MFVFIIKIGKGPALTAEMHKILYVAAHRVYNQMVKSAGFSTPSFKGEVRTGRKTFGVKSFSGVEFDAKIEVATDAMIFAEWEIKFGVSTGMLESPEADLLTSEPVVLRQQKKFRPGLN